MTAINIKWRTKISKIAMKESVKERA